MKQIAASLAVIVILSITAWAQTPSSHFASSPASQPSSAPVYSAWPFDANEAARRQYETAKALGLIKEVDEPVVAKLVAQLGDDKVTVRDEATKRLIELGESVQSLLKQKLQERTFDPETAVRIKTVLEKTTPSLDLGNKVTMKLALIPAGTFMMGSPEEEKDRREDEAKHEVTISKPFYLGICTVTQEQYEQVMDKNPSADKGAHSPVTNISWNAAVEFCEKLSQKTGRPVRLPTEAEWEYSCRAGSKARFGFGDEDEKMGDYAWYGKNSGGGTHAVGQKKPNSLGVFDMHGNVWEWCLDWYGAYPDKKETDPVGPALGSEHILRGGSWANSSVACRSAHRIKHHAQYHDPSLGFRVVVVPPGVAREPWPQVPSSRPNIEVGPAPLEPIAPQR